MMIALCPERRQGDPGDERRRLSGLRGVDQLDPIVSPNQAGRCYPTDNRYRKRGHHADQKPCRVSRSFTQHLSVDRLMSSFLSCARYGKWSRSRTGGRAHRHRYGVAEPVAFLSRPRSRDALWLMRSTIRGPPPRIIKIIPGMVIGPSPLIFLPTVSRLYGRHQLRLHGAQRARRTRHRRATEEHFRGFMKTWETELNHYLRTGDKLVSSEADLTS